MPQTHMNVPEGLLEFAYVLDENLITKMVLDNFTSFVWTERYYECGEFTMTIPVVEKIVRELKINDYLSIPESDRIMVVETMTLLTDEEGGDTLEISGRSAESILERRVIWEKLELNDGLETAVEKVLVDQIIDPYDTKRRIPGITFKPSGIDGIDDTIIEAELLGNNVYELIVGWCQENHVGFKMVLTGEREISFSLYSGVNRTREQRDTPPVIFSHSYENLLNSNYIQSEVGYASNMLTPNQKEVIRLEERTGLRRREIYMDQLPSVDNATELDAAILEKAKEIFSEHNVTIEFGSDVDIYHQFRYNVDYFLGDIVEVENRYGFNGGCRVSEMVYTRDTNGPMVTPTFVVVSKDEYEIKEEDGE